MNQRIFSYSLKNIPIPSTKLYKKHLIEKIEDVTKRMRWKAYFFEKGTSGDVDNNKFGFRTRKCPPQVKKLESFENDLIDMAKSIEFRPVNNTFQQSLKEDIASVKRSSKAFIPADKTRNMYEMDKETHDKLLHENITKTYKKCGNSVYNSINIEAKHIASKLGIGDRASILPEKEAFITLKDHKENFSNAPKCRLINPAKSNLGRASKIILEKINQSIREITQAQQWQNTKSVIDWFKSIQDKGSHTFIQFDIVDFYASISEDLLTKSITFAKGLVDVTDRDMGIIMHARKSLLFSEGTAWMKKNGESTFDVSMGSFDGAEVCELVGLYILNILGNTYGKSNIGLYRDDGLAALRHTNSQSADRIRKDITQSFKDLGLQITIQTNLKEVNFLDVTFNLSTDTYKPYKKPNDHPTYIHTNSNHPPNIIKQLHQNIGKRISEISSSKDVFDSAAPYYNKALRSSGHQQSIQYELNSAENTRKSNRKRNITWFNPPYSMNVKTNVAKKFLQLIDKHFPPHHKYHKLFNRNNTKVSYSCMPNINNIIQAHNNKVLRPEKRETEDCNCRKNAICPLENKCLMKSVVYRANVKTEKGKSETNYIGLTENTFKDRLYKHRNSFRYETKRNVTELSKHIWALQDKEIKDCVIEWSIIEQAPSHRNGSRRCELCLTEKYNILFQSYPLLNKRNELISSCRHVNKFLLNKFKQKPP